MAIAQNDVITAWYRHELGQQHHQRENAGVTMGCPIWGEAYVRRFLDYELPSIIAPANLAALDAAHWEFVVYGDQTTFDYSILEAPESAAIFFRAIPGAVMQVVHERPGYKYTLMTAVHNLLIHQAAQKGAGFSMGAADIVYSERYFERLLELGRTHDAIAHLTPIASQKSAGPLLDAWRAESLSLSASQLGSLGWEHACGWLQSCLMNDATNDSLPSTHFLVWRGANYLRMHCPHLSPVWLSNARCRAAPLDIGDTIDAANGPMYMGEMYVPQLEDDMVLITLDDTRDLPVGRTNFNGFRHGLRAYRACMPQFARPVMVPTLPATGGFLPDDVIEQRMQSLIQALGT